MPVVPRTRSVRPARLAAAAAALLVAAGGLTACTSTGGGDDGEVTTVTVGTLRGQPHFYAPFLYDDHATGDIEYEVVTLDTAPALNDALLSGTVDMAVGSITATIAGAAQGREVKVVAAASDGGSGFVGDESVQTMEDLVGKRVGYLESSSQYVVLQLMLEEAGIDIEELELVSLSAPEFFNAFDTDQIDAFLAPEIGVSLALAAGGHEIASPYETEIGRVNIGLLASQEFIDSQPDAVQEVVDTHAATTDYMLANQDEWLPEMVEEYGGDEAVFATALENFWLRSDLSPSYEEQIGNLITQMARLGMISSEPAVEEVVDTTYASRDEPEDA
ncbi:ABC transporter substrate-binding protein [Nocardioides sp. ChNu-153]|uniref:ABC transporter substrate-binding protein n=1 Tax=unclassified Nocardioides TaxID=2615069 RepID=UPI002406EF1C|nr:MULTISPECIES: ABC transporter substrate-binding protein [unclassified Nocardioides]MDF9716212.1 ABC transporter substrate-binding protein [Nocardioides sp. ChNu-99]MDN7121602.1 ABC transporter substrate-binding protein [Nocardioides sp. ChNu-153]